MNKKEVLKALESKYFRLINKQKDPKIRQLQEEKNLIFDKVKEKLKCHTIKIGDCEVELRKQNYSQACNYTVTSKKIKALENKIDSLSVKNNKINNEFEEEYKILKEDILLYGIDDDVKASLEKFFKKLEKVNKD